MRLSGTKTSSVNQYNGLGDQLYDLGGARPTLDLNFSSNESLVDSVTGKTLVDHTRQSSATYVDGDGVIRTASDNVPRFDHDPTTGESLGLLVEEDRQNLVDYSEDLSSWGGTGTAVLDSAITDPTGNTGTVYYPSIGEIHKGFNADGASKVAVSCFVKQRSGETNNSEIEIFQSVTGTIVNLGSLNLPLTGAFTPSGNFSNGTRTEYPNGWYRFTFLANADAGQGTGTFTTAGRLDVEGGASTNYVWGIQVENASFPTSYIPTEGSTVTRAADVASITGTNFSSWYEQDEGTVFTDTVNKETYPGTNVFPYILQIDDGTNNNRIGYDNSVLSTGYRYNLFCTSGGVAQGELNQFGFASGAARWASAFKTNDFALAINLSPSVLSTRTSGTLPNTMTQLQIGKGFGKQFNGTMRRLTYWPTRLSNDTLQTITA